MSSRYIEKGIPLPMDWRSVPKTDRYSKICDDLFSLMQADVGDSMLFPDEVSNNISRVIAARFGGAVDSGLTMRQTADGPRVWKVADRIKK